VPNELIGYLSTVLMTFPPYMMMWEWRYPPPTFPSFWAISMFSKVLKERAGAISLQTIRSPG